jgi:hypothetical protein
MNVAGARYERAGGNICYGSISIEDHCQRPIGSAQFESRAIEPKRGG